MNAASRWWMSCALGLVVAVPAARGAESCAADLAAAYELLGRSEDAGRDRRWVEALRGYRETEARLRTLAGRCAGDVARRARDSLGDVDYDRGVARDEMPAGLCATTLDQALARDRRAATRQLEKGPWEDVAKLYRDAETAWDDAAVVCEGADRERAENRRDDAARAREGAQTLAAAPTAPAASRSSVTPPLPAVAPVAAPAAPAAPAEPRIASMQPAAEVSRTDSAPLVIPPPEAGSAGEAAAPLPTDAPAKLLKRVGSFLVGAVEQVSPTAAKALRESRPPPGLQNGAVAAAPVVPSVTLRGPGVTYTGQFQRDAAGGTVSGSGRVDWANGNHFVGTLVTGRAEGQGTMTWADSGNRYEGAWHGDRQHGRGVLNFGDGSRYEGDFDAGRLTGTGRYRYAASGDEYEGQLVDGKPHGRGTYRWANGDRYEGQWQAGVKSGQGSYVWANGDRWEGRYENDERSGDGAMTFSSGGR